MLHFIPKLWELIGALFSAYIGVRVAVTAWDVYIRWRRSRAGDPDAWKHPDVDGPISKKEVSGDD
jgi:hypothetical protein